ncbi:MAG: DUF1330 domain-containing protein [Pseudomonadota bacterium]
MAHYLVAQITIEDRTGYATYEAGFMAIFARYGGKLLAVDESAVVLEGKWPFTRTVLIEFADEASARAWYNSDEYQALAQHRYASSQANIVMIKGLQ